jgi:hypothetical protein
MDVSPSVNIDLAPAALRRALDLLEYGPYESLDVLVESLILARQAGATRPDAVAGDDDYSLTRPPPDLPDLEVAALPETAGQLHFLTNRFGPLKLATRVLANLAVRQRSWPAVDEFPQTAAAVARRVGLKLRADDTSAGRRGGARRWIAYPVGAEEAAAVDRFVFSFTIAASERTLVGPLVQLGCVGGDTGAVALTKIGWQLAHAPSPTLDGGSNGTLSDEEVRILRARLLALPDEGAAISEFLSAVRRCGGLQGRVDELLSTWHSEWTTDRAAAERAAMLGRLGELGVLHVVGRGPTARIELLDSAAFEGENQED